MNTVDIIVFISIGVGVLCAATLFIAERFFGGDK